jgi:hypothetical protein
MPIPALLAPLLTQGLSLIGNAVMAKGKDWVEEKTGVKLDGPLSDADATKLRQYEMDHEEELLRLRIEEKKLGIEELTVMLKAAANEDNNVTDRWKSDMSSDSWLSKNIRPGTLVYILSAFILMALLDGAGYKIAEAYVTLLGQWGMLVMTAYFGGRTVEKVMEMRKGSKE